MPGQSPKYLLDTNVLSNLVRQPRGTIAERIAQVGEHFVCASIVVASELRYGAVKSGSVRLLRQVDLILSALAVLPMEHPCDGHYAQIRHALVAAGQSIGPNDLFIAAHARALDLTVVTANRREFDRVPGLSVEDWLA
jgi:tRNA(fMet)-specific endonuclease VapC